MNLTTGKFIVELRDSNTDKIIFRDGFKSYAEAYDRASLLALQYFNTRYLRSWYSLENNCVIIDYGSHTNFIKIKTQLDDTVTNLEEEHTRYMAGLFRDFK